MIQASFFATEKTAAVGFNAIKQGKGDLLLSFILFMRIYIIQQRKQNTYVVITFQKPHQALIALERDELEGGREFCYADVIKCLRLR